MVESEIPKLAVNIGVSGHQVRLGERGTQPVHDFRGALGVRARQQQREFLATPAHHVIAIAHHAARRIGKQLERAVAGFMTHACR